MNNKLFLLTLLALLLASGLAGYCQTTNPKQSFFLVPNESRVLSLSSFIRGNDLDFGLNDPSKAQIKQTFVKVDSIDLKFANGFAIFDYDMLTDLNENNTNSGVIITTDGVKSIQVADVQFISGSDLPIVNGYRPPYVLPENVNCFNGLIADQNLTIIVDCQSQSGQSLKNYICFLKKDQTQPICLVQDAPNLIKARIFKLITYKDPKFLNVTARKIISVDTNTQDSLIKVYNVIQNSVLPQSVITKADLGLTQLKIADLDIDYKNRIVLASNKNDGNFDLVSFSYKDSKPNDVLILLSSNKGIINKIRIDGKSGIIMASQGVLIEASYEKVQIKSSYPLDSTDNIIIGIQVNSQYVIAISSANIQYIWKRGNNKYLHHKASIGSSSLYLQPFSNAQLTIQSNQITLNQISSGYLLIQGKAQDSAFTLIGRSDNITCAVQFSVKFIQNNDQIFMKKNISNQKFSLKADDSLSLSLSEYFGGKDLSYEITPTDPSIHVSLRQIQKFKIINGLSGMDFYQVVGVDQNSFYLAGIKDLKLVIKLCKQKDASSFNCQDYFVLDQMFNGTVVAMDGIRRYNEQKLIAYIYQTRAYGFIDIAKPGNSINYNGADVQYSQIKFGQKFIFFTLKVDNQIAINLEAENTFIDFFGKTSFSKQQINTYGGFYPKSTKPSPSNPNIFYIKTHKGILVLGVDQIRKSIIPIKYINFLDQFLNQNLWDFVVGKETILIIAPNFLKQYSIGSHLQLNSLQLGVDLILPVSYDEVTDTVIARTKNGKLVMLRLNSGSVDYLLHEQQFQDQKVSLSWGWFVAPDSNTAYLVPKFDQLTISADISDDEFKKEFNLTLKVSGEPQVTPISVNSSLEFINFPIKIKEKNDSKQVINLPSNSNQQNQTIEFPMEKYFSGWINEYEMVCSYSQQKKIQLLTPVRQKGTNNYTFQGPALDMVSGDKFTVLLDSNQTLILIDQNNEQIASLNIKDVGADCQKIAILTKVLDNNFLFVYCIDSKTSRQTIQKYALSSSSIVKSASFAVGAQLNSKNVGQIKVISQTGQNNYWFFIHDVDKFTDTNDKQGTVKILDIENNEFSSGYTISSADFGVQPVLPINGIDIFDETHWFVSIGGQGIGYVSLDSFSRIRKNQKHYYNRFDNNYQFINLKDNESIKRYTLDNNIFQAIKIISVDQAGNAKIFISSTSSLHMVLAISINATGNEAKLVNVAETYNRMSNLPSINWAHCTKDKIVLAYYNASSTAQPGKTLIGFYNRSENGIVNSHVTIFQNYNLYQRKNNFISLHSEKNMFVIDGKSQQVSKYRFNQAFALKINYDTPGSFKTIKFIAKNGLSEISHTADVNFDALDTSGLKWYWIVLILVLVLIVVGVAFGFYRRIKAKKDKKKVSLVTQDDEQV